MIALNTATWIAIALLAPFWWGLTLLILALLASVSSWWQPHASRLFDRLEKERGTPWNAQVMPEADDRTALDALVPHP